MAPFDGLPRERDMRNVEGEGHPFAFNIALSGNLVGILDAIRKGTRISGALIRPALKK